MRINSPHIRIQNRHGASIARRLAAALLLVLLTLAVASPLRAQQDSGRAANWYDTLTVTKPRFARVTVKERLALSAFVALALPVGLAVGASTILPPSLSFLREGGETFPGFFFSTGLGFGGDSTQLTYFPVARFQVEAGYYFGREEPIVARGTLLYDVRFVSVHPRDFLWLAASAGAGVTYDFRTVMPHGELWLGFQNPLGIRYLPFFPMHNYGVRARLGYDPAAGRTWYEISLSATSTFGF